MKESNELSKETPNISLIKPQFLHQKKSSITTTPAKSKISINNINVNANSLNLNANSVLISKKGNDNINVSLFSKPLHQGRTSTQSPSPFSKTLSTKPQGNDIQLHNQLKGQSNNKRQFNKKMITNLRHQFNEIANKTTSNKSGNISIIESYINHDLIKSFLKSTKASRDNSLNGSFNHFKVSAYPTPTEYNYCETESLTLDTVDDRVNTCEKIIPTSPNEPQEMGKIKSTDTKAQSLKMISKKKTTSLITKDKSTSKEELQIKYNTLLKKYNQLKRENKDIQDENSDLKLCVAIMKASHQIHQEKLNDIIQVASNQDYSYYTDKMSKYKEEHDFLIAQNNQLKKLILLFYNNILVYSNYLIDSDKETEIRISQLLAENKMLREVSLNTSQIKHPQRQSSKSKDKADKRKSHWEDTAHNRSDTTVKLSGSNSSTVFRNSIVDNSNNNSGNISQSRLNCNYSGQFGNSNLYLKNNLKREMFESVAFATSKPVRYSNKKSKLKMAYCHKNKV